MLYISGPFFKHSKKSLHFPSDAPNEEVVLKVEDVTSGTEQLGANGNRDSKRK